MNADTILVVMNTLTESDTIRHTLVLAVEVPADHSGQSPPVASLVGTERERIASLIPTVYAELRAIAEHRLRTLSPGASLQPTELLHEAYSRLAGAGDDGRWHNRQHFIAAAALAMRSVLVDRARAKDSLKRGGPGLRQVELEDVPVQVDRPAEEILAVDRALTELETIDPRSAQVVILRYYLGLTDPEISQALGITDRTVRRDWAFARLWLQRALSNASNQSGSARKEGS